jgi:hypothetical protein
MLSSQSSLFRLTNIFPMKAWRAQSSPLNGILRNLARAAFGDRNFFFPLSDMKIMFGEDEILFGLSAWEIDRFSDWASRDIARSPPLFTTGTSSLLWRNATARNEMGRNRQP